MLSKMLSKMLLFLQIFRIIFVRNRPKYLTFAPGSYIWLTTTMCISYCDLYPSFRKSNCNLKCKVSFLLSSQNWIGNMRRKRRMEEAQLATMHNYMNAAAMPHNTSPESMAKRVRLMSSFPRPAGGAPGPYFVNVHSPTGIPMLRPGQPPPQMGIPLEAHLPPRNTPLSPRDQNIAHVGTVPQQGQQAMRAMTGAKIEPGEESSECRILDASNNATEQQRQGGDTPPKMVVASGETTTSPSVSSQHQQHQDNQEVPVSQSHPVFPEDTVPMVDRGSSNHNNHHHDLMAVANMTDMEWRQHELNKILDNVQQSVGLSITLFYHSAGKPWQYHGYSPI